MDYNKYLHEIFMSSDSFNVIRDIKLSNPAVLFLPAEGIKSPLEKGD
jgi:hypothetical protein